MALPEDPDLCSYSGDPSTSLRDEVRFWCQDTDADFWLLADAELDYLIEFVTETTNSDPLWLASVAALAIASKFTREVSVSADGVSVDVGSLQRKYLDLAGALRDQYDETHGDLDLPTLSLSRYSESLDIPPLLFGIGMADNFEAGRQDYGHRRLILPAAAAGDSDLEQW